LHHIHLEEDAGKSIHDVDPFNTLIDINRAGTALLELVTDPVLKSSQEAYAFLAAIRKLIRYIGISDGNMEEGSLRCDANVSLRKPGTSTLGVKTEIKNLNSMRFLQKALEFEITRQASLLDSGQEIIQETRGYNSSSDETYSMREKESVHDYRYFPEPDIPPVYIADEYIYRISEAMPSLPEVLLNRFTGLGLSVQEALQLTEDRSTAEYYLQCVEHSSVYKTIFNWMMGPLKSLMNADGKDFTGCRVSPSRLVELMKLVDSGIIGYSSASQKLLPAIYKDSTTGIEKIASELNLILDNDDAAAGDLVKEVMSMMKDKVDEYRKGRKGLLTLFIGEAMKKSRGKYKPELLKTLIQKELEQAF
jgi:aspartyl-tRNA(Asn)/glutamyl-tRNA(Gln) amidotransferase subunit B